MNLSTQNSAAVDRGLSKGMGFLNDLAGLAGSVGNAVSSFKGGNPQEQRAYEPLPAPQQSSNSLVLIGGGLLAVILIVVLIVKR